LIRLRVTLAVYCLALLSFAPAFALSQAAAPSQTEAPTTAQLEALSGEYTDAAEPDTPLSVYTQAGKLFIETERNVPVEITPNSALEFSHRGSQTIYRFTLDATGHALVWFIRASRTGSIGGPDSPSTISSITTSALKS